MTPGSPSPTNGGSPAIGEPRPRLAAWQLIQIAALAALLLAGMYVVDLDARALAEKRARAALVLAFEAATDRDPSARPHPDLLRAIEAYAKACAECAAPGPCEESIRTIRVEGRLPAGRGPCRSGVFERWNPDEAGRTPSRTEPR